MNNAILGSGIIAILLGFFLFTGCNEPDDFGAGFVEGESLPINFDQVFDLRGTTTATDSEITLNQATRGGDSLLLVGNFHDPAFGNMNAISYFQMRPLPNINIGGLNDVTCDSVVLDLRVARTRVYGDTSLSFTMTVHRLDDPLLNDTLLRSNEFKPFDPNPLGSFDNIKITPNTRVETSDTTSVSFFLSTHLDPSFGQEFFLDSNIYESVSEFLPFFRGLVLQVEPNDQSPVFGLNIFRRNPGGWSPGDTRLRVYYSNPDTSGVLSFGLQDIMPRYVTYEHDYTGMPVEPFITEEIGEPEYLFLEGAGGVRPRIVLPDLDQYEGKSIKVAYLELAIADDFNGRRNEDFIIPGQLAVSSLTDAGNLSILDEFIRFQTAGILQSQFGGNPVPGEIDGKPVLIYRLNISQYMQSYLNGVRSGVLIPTVFGSPKRVNRVILYGPGHPEFAARLKIIYTDI